MDKKVLSDYIDACEFIKETEEWLQEIPFRMQRIIRYKFFKELTWEEVATLMGRKCTKESVRKEFELFMK